MNATVKSARRILEMLELFASTERALALRDVAAILALPKSSASMLIGTLVQRGYLLKDEDGRFVLFPAMRDAGGWIGGPIGQVYAAAHPALDRLVETLEETIVLGAPTPDLQVRIISHRPSPQEVRYEVKDLYRRGGRPVLPAYCTAMGHAILSHLPEEQVVAYLRRTKLVGLTPFTLTTEQAILDRLALDRRRGFSLNIDERFEGASGAAVAVLDPVGQPLAAINSVTVTPRFLRRQDEIVAALSQAARALEATVFGTGTKKTSGRA